MVLIPLAQSYLWSELTQGVERVAKNSDKTLLNVLAASSAGLNEWQRMSTLVVCAAKPSAHATTIRLTECFTADGKVPRLFSQQRLLPELVTCDLKSESIWLLAPRNNALPDEDDDELCVYIHLYAKQTDAAIVRRTSRIGCSLLFAHRRVPPQQHCGVGIFP